jgi:hypothetical protein
MPGLREDKEVGEIVRNSVGKHFADYIPTFKKEKQSDSVRMYKMAQTQAWKEDRDVPNIPSNN